MYVFMYGWKHSLIGREARRQLYIICLMINLDKSHLTTILKPYKKCVIIFIIKRRWKTVSHTQDKETHSQNRVKIPALKAKKTAYLVIYNK